MRAAVGPETAGILIEPIQGEGGVRAAPPEFLRQLRALCDEHGLMLIFDEVQTASGAPAASSPTRTQASSPTSWPRAKGIGGGFPLGACLATAEGAKGMTAGTHGTRSAANPLGMAVGNAVLDVVLADGFLDEVRHTALLFKQSLASLKDRFPDIVEEVRGEGLLIGLKPRVPNGQFVETLRRHQMLAAPPVTTWCASCRRWSSARTRCARR